ncbi:HAD-IA family hydrolase [Pyrococcus abyssi]|uniref:Hydrolase, HAD superfamily n=1 Tax=Pyrococcus abyssi (strain GE5 / Orsay) TaxID=272844 RepID=Q9UXS9_PYRAB|nr:HAD-IA family hydrolase [Pyrococcus abyssi]CAB50684.1 Hydrolase, putative [Pyrococcus abyssi GE5]CCE71253.1 TPA: Hydrolase, HAD superfamily [Pyrococcus abyssi GE5]
MIIAFDFDGTLVDSYSCIEEAFYRALEREYPWLPGKRSIAKLLTKLELQFERPKFGKTGRKIRPPLKIFQGRFARAWFEERAKLTKPLDGAHEVLKELRDQGHIVISFSAEDFIPGIKEFRLRQNGLYDLFDDVIIFGKGVSIKDAFSLVRKKYGNETFVWVDDKPWRFIGNGDENTEYVWMYFPYTARFVTDDILDKIPHLHVIYDLWSLLDVVKRLSV